MLQKVVNKTVTNTGITGATLTTAVDLADTWAFTFASQNVITVTTPGAKGFTSANVTPATDTITITGHGLFLGLKGQFTTSGTLPTGISAATDYFVIVVDANNVKFATSYANALAGTPVDITGAGSGSSTFTPTALAGASITPQISNDNVTWDDYQAATNITVSTTAWFYAVNPPPFRYFRWKFAITAGSLTSADNQLVRAYTS